MTSKTNCNPQNVDRFVRHELSNIEVRQLENHLAGCQACQCHLGRATADDRWWDDARSWLSDDGFDTNRLECIATSAERKPDDVRADDTSVRCLPPIAQQIIDVLGPTDDPQMLGRIDNYEVVGVIGSGGMGVVLKCLDKSLNRFVAIKALAPHLAASGAARQRFAREAQAAAAVIHENVIAIHGVAEAAGIPYLVMPYERSISLQKRLDDEGPLNLVEILRIAMQVASGLAAAHAQGLVHRDVKPANILLADGVERVRITDFGLARAVDDGSLTRTGVIVGTPQYMSPEQARGEAIDARSDLFSLGSVIYAMCVGHAPFRAETSYGVLRRISDSEPTPVTQLNPLMPDWLIRLTQKLHAKSPDDRYQYARQVADDLARCLAHLQQPEHVQLPVHLTQVLPSANQRRRPIIRLLLRGGLVSAIAVSVAFLLSNSPDTDRSRQIEAPTRHSPKTRWDDGVSAEIQRAHLDLLLIEQGLDVLRDASSTSNSNVYQTVSELRKE